MLSCSTKLTCTAYSNPTSNITTAAAPIWAWTKMPRNHDQCRVRRRARLSRSPRWAACTIATNAWRPEVAILRTHGPNIAGPTGGVERGDSRRLAKIRSAPSPEGPRYWTGQLLLGRPASPARPHPITFLPTTAARFIAAAQHGHALGEKDRGQEVSFLALAQFHDCRVIGRPLYAVVPR